MAKTKLIITASLKSRAVGLMFLVAAITPAGGCIISLKMAVPDDVSSQSLVLQATERSRARGSLADETFVLGTYRVENVDRSATRSEKNREFWSELVTSVSNSSYSYELRTEVGERYYGYCEAESLTKEREVAEGFTVSNTKTNAGCSCSVGEGKPMSTFSLTPQKQSLTIKGQTYDLKVVTRDTQGYFRGNLGWVARQKDRAIGAVETTHPGRVWLNKSLSAEEKNHLTCMLAGLMLRPTSDD